MKLEGSVCAVENGVERRKDGERMGERMTSGMNRDSRRSPVVVPLDEQAARCLLRPLARCGRRSLLRRRRHLLLALAARMSHVMDVAVVHSAGRLQLLMDAVGASLFAVVVPRSRLAI